jgi:TolB-like protein/Tfp pilus assembly protein PilF
VTPERLHHRLSVVWFTDIVGYSSLSARDQDEALAVVGRFQDAVREIVPREQGRVVKFIGDAALLESPSAEAALRGAIALHDALKASVRTGIHLGDVMVAADDDLYGDGVNAAQRIQAEAEPGQIVVSEDVWRRMRNRPAFHFESMGERRLKGVEAMELFRVVAFESAERVKKAVGEPIRSEEPVSASARSIAVLPFVNLSANQENEYFSDGVTETILMTLTKLGGLKVISRTSVMQYKGTAKPIRQIGEELDVTTILEGSVQRAGERVRITAQLIDSRTDEHLWADTYDRNLDDIFAIQSEVAERIAGSLKAALTPAEKERLETRPTENVGAYEWYLKGRDALSRRTETNLRRAIELFRKAVSVDPAFALAWAGLADAYSLLPGYATSPVKTHPEARAAAEQALALDSGLGEAHASLGLVAQDQWEWKEAEREYLRAVELSPAYATAHHWYGNFLSNIGRFDEGIAELERALELDPLSLPVHNGLAIAHLSARRYDQAIELLRKVVEMEPGYVIAYINLGEVYEENGDLRAALEEWETASRLDPAWVPPVLVGRLRAGLEERGTRGYWEAWVAELGEREAGPDRVWHLARACARLGRLDEAFGWLDRLVEERHPAAGQIRNVTSFDSVRADPRFDALLEKMGLR